MGHEREVHNLNGMKTPCESEEKEVAEYSSDATEARISY